MEEKGKEGKMDENERAKKGRTTNIPRQDSGCTNRFWVKTTTERVCWWDEHVKSRHVQNARERKRERFNPGTPNPIPLSQPDLVAPACAEKY